MKKLPLIKTAEKDNLVKENSFLYNSFMNVPAGIAVMYGENFIYEFANIEYERLVGRKITIGKTFKDHFPELEDQGVLEILSNSFSSGKPFIADEFSIILNNDTTGEAVQGYYNVVIQPMSSDNHITERILTHSIEVTQQVKSRIVYQESEKRFTSLLSQSVMAIAILKGIDHTIEFANEQILNAWGKGADVIGLPFFDVLPELKEQGFPELIENVLKTRIPYYGYEAKVNLVRNEVTETCYYNFVYEPYTEIDNSISGITILATDVTEHYLAKKKIEKNEIALMQLASHLKLATESANVGTWSYHLENQKLEWSSLHKQMWGYDANLEELNYQDWHILIMDEDKEKAFEKVEEARINHSIYDVEYKIQRNNDGEIRWIRSVGKYLYNKSGDAETLNGISLDVTNRKIAENKILESENQFRVFADSIQNLAWIASSDGSITWYNKQWYDYTGTSFQEMEGSGWRKVHHPIHVEKISNFLLEAWKKDEPFELIFPLRRHDGEFHWFLTRAYPVKNINHTIERWIGTSTDITEQKNFNEALEIKVSERTAELYLKNKTFEIAEKIAKFGSYKWNITTGSLEYSDNLFLLLDCEPNEFEPSFEKFLSFIHPEDLNQVVQNGEQTVETGALVETPYRIISKLGKIKHLRSSGKFIGENENRILIGTVQDISKDIADAEELKTKNLELQSINEELKSFTHIASHDLQEPLRKIQMFTNRILDNENFSDTNQHYFERIKFSAQRMQNLIISLLDFSRAEKSEMLFVTCDLNEIVKETISDLQINIIEKKAIIKHQDLPTITGIAIQLSQLFTNLIDNAIKYSREDVNPIIKISCKQVHGNQLSSTLANNVQDYYELKIEDNGIGFQEEDASKIFELFQRLHHKDQYSGTGIGLSIVKKVVNNHNGFIEASGKINVGSTFTIYLPVNQNVN